MCDNRRVKYVGFPANPVTAVYFIPARTLLFSSAAAVAVRAASATAIG
jgi:hypothetical protein